MTDSEYTQGYADAVSDIASISIEHAVITSADLDMLMPRLSMYRIGYVTAVRVAMEKVWA